MVRLLSIFLFFQMTELTAGRALTVDQYFEHLTNINQFNGVVMTADSDGVILHKAYQSRAIPAWGRVEKDSRFHIASVRKLFTQFVVFNSAKSRDLLDKPLTDWVNMQGLHPKWTLKMLLEHRAGLPRGEKFDFDREQYSERQLRRLIEQQPLLAEPDSQYLYSNFGYLLVDIALSDWHQKSANKVYQTLIYNPLKMFGTGSATELASFDGIARGIYKEDGELLAANLIEFQRFPYGDVFSTASDMMTFLRSDEAQVLAEANIIEHAGAKRGYRSYVYHNVATGNSLVILSNLATMPITRVIQDIKQLMEGREVELPSLIQREAIRFQPDIARQLEGEYRLKINGQRFHLTCDKRVLVLNDISNPEAPKAEVLYFQSRDILFSDPASLDYLKVIRHENNVVSFSIIAMGGAEFETERLKSSKVIRCE